MSKALKILNIGLFFVLIAGLFFGVTHAQEIKDFLALRSYKPPAEVVKLADETTMNDKTRNVFYVNKPKIEEKKDFIGVCTQKEQTIILGCYIGNEGIYLLNVTDKRLQGIIEVTAAHEVLHAMYDRLSESEKANVDKMTSDFFSKLNNPRIQKNIASYQANDPSSVPNELHSILGTEVRNLSSDLEQYYSKYFINRKAIVAYSEKYEQTFINIENQVKALDAELKEIKKSIETKDQEINSLGVDIDNQRKEMDRLLKNNKINEYNSGVDNFNSLVNRYNRLIADRQNQAEKYNQKVDQYNKLASTETELINSLKTDNFKPITGAGQ